MFAVMVVVIICGSYFAFNASFKTDFYGEIAAYCTDEIDPSLVLGMIKQESGFRKDAISNKGACGLMQLMPETAAWLANEENFDKRKLFEPKINIELGIKYLRYLTDKFISMKLVLAAYNAGEGNVKVWLDKGLLGDTKDSGKMDYSKIPFSETRNYIKKVMKNYEVYQKILAD